MTKEKKQKTGARKTIDGKMHACVMQATIDPRYTKCCFCPRVDRVK